MFFKWLDDEELELLQKISNETGGDYEIIGNQVPANMLMDIIKDLFTQYECLKEKYEEEK